MNPEEQYDNSAELADEAAAIEAEREAYMQAQADAEGEAMASAQSEGEYCSGQE